MIIKKWSVYNYGPFYGNLNVNFPELVEEKNIIIFHGLNGQGKTSLNNSLKLALYGENANLHIGQTYHQYLRDLINRTSKNEGNDQAYVEVEFNTEDGSLCIKREWKMITKERASESIEIRRNGVLLNINEVDSEKIINNIIPVNILQFFAFDAEKIRYVVDDNKGYGVISKDINDILNISPYINAQERLNDFSLEISKKKRDVSISQRTKVLSEKQAIKEQLSENEELLRTSMNKNNDSQREYEDVKKWLFNRGYKGKEQREKLIIQQEYLSNEMIEVENSLSEIINDYLPYLVVYDELELVKEQLSKEKAASNSYYQKLDLVEKKKKILETLDLSYSPDLTKNQRESIKNRLGTSWDNLFKQDSNEITLIHLNTVALSEREYFINNIETILSNVKINKTILTNNMQKYNEYKRKINNNELELKSLPNDFEISSAIRQFDELKSEIENTQKVIVTTKEEIERLKIKFEKKDKELDRLKTQIEENNLLDEKINIGSRVIELLNQFTNSLKVSKAREVQKSAEQMYKTLAHKKDLIKNIVFDDKSFIISLFNYDDEVVKLATFSEGEKQIYGLSLTAALAKCSMVKFPFLIDTPLAKLDSLHRDNVIKEFLPSLSRQVIILSTDTELTPNVLRKLKSYVMKEFTLINENGKSYIVEGRKIVI